LDICIFTHDFSLLTDKDVNAHLQGVEDFCHQVQLYQQQGMVKSLTITVIESRLHNEAVSLQATDGIIWHRQFKIQAVQIFTQIKKKIDSLSKYLSFDLVLSAMECPAIEFQSLVRQWLRKEIGTFRISFDLPETADGCSCSISLVLVYKVLEESLMSQQTQRLIQQARAFEHSVFEVVQLIANDEVDASLIYGNALLARAASHEDTEKDHEMGLVASQLWKWLAKSDVSILLRTSTKAEYFLLISEFGTVSSCLERNEMGYKESVQQSGVLFRYAANEQLLQDNGVAKPPSSNETQDISVNEANAQYYEYLDKVLGSLPCSAFNPTMSNFK